MSYDISIGPDLDLNYTSNVSPMWDQAMSELHLRDMHGRTGKECLPHLLAGVIYMMRWTSRLDGMAPDNGWGDRQGAMEVLAVLAEACAKHPRARMRVYR